MAVVTSHAFFIFSIFSSPLTVTRRIFEVKLQKKKSFLSYLIETPLLNQEFP